MKENNFIFMEDLGFYVEDRNTPTSLLIEIQAENFFFNLENILENKKFKNNLFKYAFLFFGIVILSNPQNVFAQTILREKIKNSKVIETTIENSFIEPINQVKQKTISGIKHRLGHGELINSKLFNQELILKVFNEENLTKIIIPVKNIRIKKEVFVELIEIHKPLIVKIPVIENKVPGSSFFSGSFVFGINVLAQNLKIFQILCIPQWLPLPWGTRAAIKGISAVKNFYIAKKEKTKTKTKNEENNDNFLAEMFKVLEKPEIQKSKNVSSPIGLPLVIGNNMLQILVLLLGAFYLRLNKKDHLSKLLVKVGVSKPIKPTFYETIFSFLNPKTASFYVILGSTGFIIYIYWNRETFLKSNSIFSLAFGFMEKQMNLSLKLMADSSLFVQNLTMKSLKKLDDVSEIRAEEIVFLKTKIEALETDAKLLVEKHHIADKSLSITQNSLNNCRLTLSETEFNLLDTSKTTFYPSNIAQINIEGPKEPSTVIKENLLLKAKEKFPDSVIQENSLSGTIIVSKKDDFLQILGKQIIQQLGNTQFH